MTHRHPDLHHPCLCSFQGRVSRRLDPGAFTSDLSEFVRFVPGHSYFQKIEGFVSSHYEERENYRDFIKYGCSTEVGPTNCSFCRRWTGPVFGRCPKPVPDHAQPPAHHYPAYTVEGRTVDDLQSCVQLKQSHEKSEISLSDEDSVAAFADRYIVKPKFVVSYLQHLDVLDFKRNKRKEERAKTKKEEEEKACGDYDWEVLCENSEELNRLSVPELEKYLNHHGIQHREGSSARKIK